MTTPAKANNFDWDVVFAARASVINKAIASQSMYPDKADYKDGTSGYWFKADIDSWQITPGGDSHHVLFNIVFSSFAFGGPNIPAGFKVPSDIVAQAKLALEFVSQDGVTHHLKVKQSPNSTNTKSGNTDHAISVSFTPGEVKKWKLPVTRRIKMQQAISKWLNGSLADFKHVFAMIDVMDAGATGDFAWLKATSVDYAYCPNAQGDTDLDHAVLGVLAMTGGHDKGNNAIQVSPAVIPPGMPAGCVIDKGLYLNNAIINHLPLMFKRSTVNDFEYIADKKLIQLANPVDLDGVKSSDYTDCPCQLTELELEIVADEFRLMTATRVLVKQTKRVVTSLGGYGQPGQSVEVTENVCYSCARETSFYKLAAGQYDATRKVQDVSFIQTRVSKDPPWVEPPPEDPNKIVNDVINYLTLAATIGATVVDPALGVVYMLGFTAANIAKAVENDSTELANFNKAPYIDNGTIIRAMTLKWGGYDEFELTDVYLNDGIQFGGDFYGQQ